MPEPARLWSQTELEQQLQTSECLGGELESTQECEQWQLQGCSASPMLGHLHHCGHQHTQQVRDLTTGIEQLKTNLCSPADLTKLLHSNAGLVSPINPNQKA